MLILRYLHKYSKNIKLINLYHTEHGGVRKRIVPRDKNANAYLRKIIFQFNKTAGL